MTADRANDILGREVPALLTGGRGDFFMSRDASPRITGTKFQEITQAPNSNTPRGDVLQIGRDSEFGAFSRRDVLKS
jgi:hypothetical protein